MKIHLYATTAITNKLLYGLVMALLSGSCSGRQAAEKQGGNNGKERIRSVIYTNAGGGLGWSETLVLSADSVSYNTLLAARNNLKTAFSEKNTPQQWAAITGQLDLESVKKVISGASQQPVDGTDQTYTIITGQGAYRFMNPDFKTHPDTALEKWMLVVDRLAATYHEKAR